ncbi:facilitated trehalose transporter Tret1-like isoform X2 [Photinus pyralis]|uniref:facilitated trehalose transporter Tret1-like isoform X2 n=1 Tax=Photinus pyralis TaxID=7054 RepID=UPI0012673D5A|nr:facilitated trehalose transporter Tret1-like isoform X2 [Photinus pyralis]
MTNFIKEKVPRYMQYVTVFSASLASFCALMVGTWASPSIPRLLSKNSPIGVTLNHEASWVTSAPPLGFTLGSLLTPVILDVIGPKRSLLLAALPLTIAWFGTAFSKSAVLLILMRFIAGLADGGILTASLKILPLYVGEVSDKDIRGKLITFHTIVACMGSLFVLSIGPFIQYQTLALTCGIFPLIFVAIFYFMPDSPYFLIKKGKLVEGKRSLRRLLAVNASQNAIEARLNEIEQTIAKSIGTRRKVNLWHILSERHFRIALFFSLNLKLIFGVSGWTTIKAFLQTIIGAAASSISPQSSSLILGILQLPSVTVAAFLVDKLGRKALLVVSSVGCAITMGIVGLYFYLQDVVKADLQMVSWLPTICIALYLSFLPMGIFTVSSVIPGEIFADNVKSLSAAISVTFSGSWTFLVSKFFLQISDAWGMYAMFWIFSAVCCYGALFGLFILPETKGKSFIEIQNSLKQKRYC